MYFPSSRGSTAPAAAGAPAPSSGGDKKDDNITGKFDPTALERGAKALKELDASPNATKAFEITKLQEQSKQKEIQKEIEQLQTARTQAGIQKAQVEAEERRKTMSHQQEQERVTAQYKAQLEAEAYNKKLQDQQKQNDAWLQKQHEQFLRHEEIRKKNELALEEVRRKNMREQAEIDRETQMQRIKAETQGKILQERENQDIHLRNLRAQAGEDRATRIESIKLIFSGLGNAFNTLMEDKQKLATFVGGMTALAVGIYGARAGTGVAGRYFESRLGKPPLVRETSRWSLQKGFGNISTLLPFWRRVANFQEKIVLPPELSEKLQWTTTSLMHAKENGNPFRHILLHGPPGTGKTLFARTVARESGLDYAIMSGGDVGPLGKDAVAEINKIFAWANKSKKGMILFIDEADAFLRKGRGAEGGMSEDMRNALSAFLAHTGTETDKFSIVLASNVKDVLDRAVLDRIDDDYELGLPGLEERKRMLNMFMNEYIQRPTKKGKKIAVDEAINESFIEMVAQKTDGFSGRQLAKLIISMQAAVFGSGTNTLTKGLAETVLNWKLAHFNQDIDTVLRRQRDADTKKTLETKSSF